MTVAQRDGRHADPSVPNAALPDGTRASATRVQRDFAFDPSVAAVAVVSPSFGCGGGPEPETLALLIAAAALMAIYRKRR